MAKKNSNVTEKIGERSTLSVRNYGDTVVIKNRSAVGGGIFGAIIMVFSVMVAAKMREAWSSPAFWCVFAFLFVCSAYWFANAVFGRIILDSPKKMMTVYGPFKKEYRFSDVNYIETVSAKPKNGCQVHTVYVYIGNGRRNVRIDTLSSTQAKEIETLFKGMLDSDVDCSEEFEKKDEPEVKRRRSNTLLERLNRKADKTEETADDVDVSKSTFDDSLIIVTRDTVVPEKTEETSTVSRDAELDRYEAHLIRRNKK